MLHCAPFLSTHFFPCLNPICKNGSFLSVVALVSVTHFDSKKDQIWHRLRPPPSRGLRQLNFPNVKNDVGQNNIVREKNFVKESPAEGRRRLHKNTAYAHLWGFNRPFC